MEATRGAVEAAQQATQRAPDYAPAYVALAAGWFNLGSLGGVTYREGFTKAKQAALRAVELDERLPRAHALLGQVSATLDWDWERAERQFQRALELNPSSADAHLGYGFYLASTGRPAEGVASAEQSIALDPLNPWRRGLLDLVHYMARQYQEALEAHRETARFVEMARGRPAMYYVELGRLDEARRVALEVVGTPECEQTCQGHLGNVPRGRARSQRLVSAFEGSAKA